MLAPSACDSSCWLQIGLDTGYWTAINHFFIWGSVAVYFAILFAMHSNGLFDMFPNQFRFVGESLWLPLGALGCHDCSGTNRVGSWSHSASIYSVLLRCQEFWGDGWVCLTPVLPSGGCHVRESEEQPY